MTTGGYDFAPGLLRIW